MDRQKLTKYLGLGAIALVAVLMLIAMIRANGKGKYFGYPDAGTPPLPVLPFDPLDPNSGVGAKPHTSAVPSASGAAGSSAKN